MTCPTCNGSMMLPNPNGIGVVACTDCKDGKIKRSNMKETTKPEANLFDAKFSAAIAVVCLALAFMLCSNGAAAQSAYYIPKKELHQASKYYFFYTENKVEIAEPFKGLADSTYIFSKYNTCINCEGLFPMKEQYDILEAGWGLLLAHALETKDPNVFFASEGCVLDGLLQFYSIGEDE